ncbi:Peptide synthetase [Minicystis rosea]|nr:Peptide synthetase [Minicystis rosea]
MEQRAIVVAIAASFTADPIERPLRMLLDRSGIEHRVALAGYDQVQRELCDRAGLFAQNRDGVDVALVRLVDLSHARAHGQPPSIEAVRRGARDLADLVAGHTGRAGAPPLLLVIGPDPRALLGDAAYAQAAAATEATLAEDARAAGAQVVTSAELAALYPVDTPDDSAADALAHIPYSAEMFAALGATVARKVRARVAPPYKVLALDADNTLWTGVVGEDGPEGVILDEGRLALQRFARAQHEAGLLLCLCSKNAPEDVEEVFRRREMPLERRHFAASRVSWRPKSESLRALASELSLGLDAFVFVDDSALECAEVRASCPEVLTVHLPQTSAEAAALLQHVWAFDRWGVTDDDRQRAERYRQSAERDRVRREAPSMAEFLASMSLEIRIETPSPADLPRLAQLTFRTNQLNVTTGRRSEAELAALLQNGHEALVVEVRDRFGDYGLVGLILFEAREDALVVDTFLLSCRVLQRGVEHQMLSHLGATALARRLARVDVPLAFTAKNLPAQALLRSLGNRWLTPREGGFVVRFPSSEAAALTYVPEEGPPAVALPDEGRPKPIDAAAHSIDRIAALTAIAHDFSTAAAIAARATPTGTRRPRPSLRGAMTLPRSELERTITSLCEDALGISGIGVTDDLFLDLGADSFAAVRIAAELRRKLGCDAEVVTVQEARTVERLALWADPTVRERSARVVRSGRSPSIHALRAEGKKRPLFLGRPATRSGGGLSYVALARHIDPDRPIYVFQNRPLLDGARPYGSIEEMAGEYLAAMREVQPTGPYLLAGWCLGGKTVFEMANRLLERGERVERLILFDTAAPRGLYARIELLARRAVTRAELRVFARRPWLTRLVPWLRVARAPSLLRRFGVLAYFDHDNDDVALIDYAFPGLFDRDALRALTPDDRWQHVYATLCAAEPNADVGDGIDAVSVRRGYKYFAWDHCLDAAYSPRWVYPGDVTMLAVRGTSLAAGWEKLLAQPPEVCELDIRGTRSTPDPHSAMMAEENVTLVAPELNRCLGDA